MITLIFLNKEILATSEVINSQAQMLNVSSFLDSAQESTKEIFGELNYNDVFTNLIQGKANLSEVLPRNKKFIYKTSYKVYNN